MSSQAQRTSYKFLSESANKLRLTGKMFSGTVAVVWADYTQGKKSRCGAVRMALPTPHEQLSHEAVAAFNDIDDFEIRRSSSSLSRLSNQGVAILHATGYYQDRGFRRMVLVPPDGCTENLIRPNSMVPRYTRLHPDGKSSAPMDEIISSAIYLILSEAPSAYLFLHFLGQDVELDAVKRYVRVMPEYQRVSGGILDLSGRGSQLANVNQLIIMEDRNLIDPLWSYSSAYAYRQEVDKAQYFLFGNGKSLGFSNKRAMHGMIERALTTISQDCLLVHRMGSALDFDLIEKVLAIDPTDGMIERPERFKQRGST
jgi:hypothetical protein